VLRDGTFIHLPRITLEVIEACSGLRFLTSVVAIAIPLVYLTQRSWPRALAVIASGVAITVLSNGIRVALAGITADHYGEELLHGPYKLFQGWFVAQAGFIGLFVINWAVSKAPSRSATKLYERWRVSASALPRAGRERAAFLCPLTLVALFLTFFGAYVHLFSPPTPLPPKRSLSQFPSDLGEWTGRESSWMNGNSFFPATDAEVTRTYRSARGREVHLFVGYYASQFGGRNLVNHHSKSIHEGMQTVPNALGASAPQQVNRSALSIEHNRYATLFWYRTSSGDLTGRHQTRYRAIFDGVIHRRNNGAVILLAVPLIDEPTEALVSNDLLALARVVAPTLDEFLP
jgi:EpsI family protein